MSFLTKYNNTSSEIFKLRMQLKAEMNDLRRTYEEVVLEKSQPKKRIYEEKLLVKTYIVPEERRSLMKTPQKRHFSPSPIVNKEVHEKSSLSCKRQYKNINDSNSLREALKQEANQRKKSKSPILRSRHNSSMFEMLEHNQSCDGLKINVIEKPIRKERMQSIKIIPKYHVYKYDLLLG